MIMTPEDMRPALGQPYRHRKSGRVATLRGFQPWHRGDRTHGLVRLEYDAGWEWCGGQADFWETWIHADASEGGGGD